MTPGVIIISLDLETPKGSTRSSTEEEEEEDTERKQRWALGGTVGSEPSLQHPCRDKHQSMLQCCHDTLNNSQCVEPSKQSSKQPPAHKKKTDHHPSLRPVVDKTLDTSF
eukprot:CAMPEP_0195039508 /NCGR_PEP_ID=MMETSP0326_2-20130528/79833_1 /TAXON_ID=2866 ORGANISM="Crypthecodinium cohnii, Strain Seligo" /NCGR_SAMPLE_ID=MMETSP0326_2 /ASSEMBLY_ACC=CAM_ASM_000348 /LENGTH=109 /DNA_ID=CAMNT_0040066363 /DNA_START=39 /DNA_END=368 /DNA_ORIENTATION=-